MHRFDLVEKRLNILVYSIFIGDYNKSFQKSVSSLNSLDFQILKYSKFQKYGVVDYHT